MPLHWLLRVAFGPVILLCTGCAPNTIDESAYTTTEHQSGVVEFHGRSGFEPYPIEAPPISAVRVGDAKEKPIHLYLPLAASGIEPGDVVADVGCGKGRHSFEFAEAAGSSGLVFCRDTDAFRIEQLRETLASIDTNVDLDVAVSERHDVHLPDESIDVAILVDVFVYVLKQTDSKGAFLDSLYASMKPGGVVVIVHVKSSHLSYPEQQREVHQQTIDAFTAHGFVAGRRFVFPEERRPPEILEFQRPR